MTKSLVDRLLGRRRKSRDLEASPPTTSPWPGVLAPLFPEDPYAGFDVADHPEDLQGWASTDPIFEHAIQTLRPHLIIEVGTWKGASAIHMANLCRDLRLDTKILCIDTWLGSPEHLLPRPDRHHWRTSLRIRHGFPQLYLTFLANVIRHGHTDRILPLPQPSENAAELLRQLGVQADIVYVDAAHEYAPAKRDYDAFWPLVSKRGAMICDDYVGEFAGVMRAADEFAEEVGKPLLTSGIKCILDKGGALGRAKAS